MARRLSILTLALFLWAVITPALHHAHAEHDPASPAAETCGQCVLGIAVHALEMPVPAPIPERLESPDAVPAPERVDIARSIPASTPSTGPPAAR